jgi:microcystin-dependent protein
MEMFLGEIALFPYAQTPVGWMPCEGQTMEIASHQALYDLLGMTFGGDGSSTFELPDLREKAPPGTRYFIAIQGSLPLGS